MKVYHNDEKNINKRHEPFFRKMVHYVVSFGMVLPVFFIYYLLSSFFKYNSNFKKINSKLINFFVSTSFYFNCFFLRKNIFKTFNHNDIPNSGCFMIFNHVNEFEYPYDFYFGKGIPLFDMGVKKLGLLSHIVNRMGIALNSGRKIKKSIEEIDEYLNFSNIIFYPEGERSFSDYPKIYKKGILRLIYENQYKIIVFYKGGMERLDNNLFYYKSELIESKIFNTFEDFYQFVIAKNKLFFKNL